MTGELCGKLMLEKVPGELRWKPMLEKVTWEMCGKLMLEKVPGELCENCRESDRKSAVSRIQCYKPQVEKTTVQASDGHGNESCFTHLLWFEVWFFFKHSSQTAIDQVFATASCRLGPLCSICRDLCALTHVVKCRDLRALTHVGKMSRFAHFARHKILAARHFQLFCTPAQPRAINPDHCQPIKPYIF